jgi:hypothetical protein
MADERFESFINGIRCAVSLSSRQKADLEQHLEALAQEFAALDQVSPQAAQSILNFLACALYESSRRDRSTPLATQARKGMLLSFRAVEETHPDLATKAYALGDVLAAVGV